MEGLFNIVVIFGMIVVCASFSSSKESSLHVTTTARTSLTTSKVHGSVLPKPSSWHSRRINVDPVAAFSSTPYDWFRVTGPQRRNNVHFEWDYWCQSQPKPGNCLALRFKMQNYYYDTQTDTCKKFIFSGCEGNKNNFQSKVECERHCKGSNYMTLKNTKKSTYCGLQPNVGICLGLVQRYYYDVKINDCSTFIYGGCGGNQNRFDSYELCIKRCKDE